MNIRERIEESERSGLSPHAQLASASQGRVVAEELDDVRTCFQRDRDRVIHAKSFRRLAHKTQVFLSPEGDHYRTRITHTLEVSQVARTMASCLRLSEPLAEVIAMGHDLGHTPFGHAGEEVLSKLMPGGFHHARQSLRVIDQLEKDGRGLNLTHEVRDGILKHSKGKGPIISDNPNLLAMTLEGQLVRVADIIAYANHDLDDAMRAGLLVEKDVPEKIRAVIGEGHAPRLRRMVLAVVDASNLDEKRAIRMDEDVLWALTALRDFLYETVYYKPAVRSEFVKAQRVLGELWAYHHAHGDEFHERFWPKGTREEEGLSRAVCDYLSGMTDRFALRAYDELLLPQRWGIY